MKRVLVANRGEIAIRIIKTLKKSGIESVSIYHADEKGKGHMHYADISVCLGSGSLSETYLNIPKLISISKDYNCDAVHPGYGFLSENYNFAYACEANNITFIGPKPSVIQAMSIKSEAKLIAKQANIPVLEGTPVSSVEEAKKQVLDFPILIKAVAGGGGKGLKIVRKPDEFESAFKSAQRESIQYFANGELMLEPYIEGARHIEVQVFGDESGDIVHLHERECSIQRNYQKIIEEAPAFDLSVELRNQLHEAAVRFAKQLNYTNAGTVEFLVDGNTFWFLEMNTRIQVEHPVTEMVTGVDVVEEQIRIAEGKKLSPYLHSIKISGHAIESRIYSEAPFEGFRPSIGKVLYCEFPENVRIDSFISSGTEITPHFDSMLAKVIVHEEDRETAISKLLQALGETVILGVDTNITYLEEILSIREFAENNISTSFLNEYFDTLNNSYHKRKDKLNPEKLIPVFVYNELLSPKSGKISLWQYIGRDFKNHTLSVYIDEKAYEIILTTQSKNSFSYYLDEVEHFVQVLRVELNKLTYTIDGKLVSCAFTSGDVEDFYFLQGQVFKVSSPSVLRMALNHLNKKNKSKSDSINQVLSPLFGKVINVNVKEADKVKKGQILLTIESMKTENHILSPGEGIVDTINVKNGIQVKENIELLTLLPVV